MGQGLDTTPNGKYLFAGQGDNRVRAWSLLDGQRLLPDPDQPNGPDARNPLNEIYYTRPTAITAGDGVLNVGVAGGVQHFGAPYSRPLE